jgi:predicted acetyltransferase
MQIDVRTIADAEIPAWCAALNTGFLNPAGDIDAEARRPAMILDRTWGAFDGDRIVATLRSFPAGLTVPGGARLDTAAVTAVTTSSTHRRRGLASRMVIGDLAAAKDRGERAAILIAAEWGIYGRFGYGAATEHQTWTVDAIRGRLRNPPQGTVEFVDRDTARGLAPAVFERHRAKRPGEITRTDRYWDLDYGILHFPSWKEPKPAFHVVGRDNDGTVVGLVRYTYEDESDGRLPKGKVNVQTFLTDGPAAEALLWHYLLGIDLASTIRVDDRPADELLPWLLVDARHAQPANRADFLWIRPLDVPAMLTARSYAVAGRVVVEVVDPGGFTGGRFALDAGPDGASCTPTTTSADLSIGVAALGSIYLGGHGLRTLAAAGLADEHTNGAVDRADGLLRWPVAPWCSTWF